MSAQGPASEPSAAPQVITRSLSQMEAVVQASATRTLEVAEREDLLVALRTLAAVQSRGQEPTESSSAVKKLLKIIFGTRSERKRVVLKKKATAKSEQPAPAEPPGTPGEPATSGDANASSAAQSSPVPCRKGHGRYGAAAYTGAKRVKRAHPTLKTGDPCPAIGCKGGKMYRYYTPKVMMRIEGTPLLSATIYELEQWRCHLCGKLVCAPAPPEAGEEKYLPTAVVNMALAKYCVCLPGRRLQMLQDNYGVPVADATMWEVLREKKEEVAPVHEALLDTAAQVSFLFDDDTNSRVLEVSEQERAKLLGPQADPKRSGMFTTGVVAKHEGHEIALYFTGPRYAGENLDELLKRRDPSLPAPVLMCDGLTSRNLPKGPVILCQDNVHARRQFVDVVDNFPEDVAFVLDIYTEVFKTEAKAKKDQLSDEQRLALHRKESGPRMKRLREWLEERFEKKLVEPNSGLGRAIKYTLSRWIELNRFLEIPGAAVDSNVVEQILRRVAHYRNASLYFRTLKGAQVADCWMSLIRTAEKAGVNVFDYLVALLEHPQEVKENPKAWFPWTYGDTLAQLETAAQIARAA